MARAKQTLAIMLLTVGWFGIQMNMAYDETQFQFILNRLVDSAFVIGAVLALGPLCGIIVQPVVGFYSDVLARRGISRKRLIFYAGGLAIVCVYLLPAAAGRLTSMVLTMGVYYFFLNVLMVAYRAFSTEASNMPSLKEYKGSISGFIALFTGAGAFVMYLVCSVWGGTAIPFRVGATVLLLSLLGFSLFLSRIGEPAQQEVSPPEKGFLSRWNLLFYMLPFTILIPAVERRVARQAFERPVFRLFLTVYLSWFGFQAIRAFFILYTSKVLDFSHGWANMLLAIVTLVMLAAAVPLGRLADRLDDTRLLRYSLLVFATGSGLFYFFEGTEQLASLFAVIIGLGLAGTTVYPMSILFKLCPPGQEGTYTGLYNLFISVPQLHSLLLTGWLIDVSGTYQVILVITGLTMLASCWSTFQLPSFHQVNKPGT